METSTQQPFDVPELPPHYLLRAELLARLKEAVLDQKASPVTITGAMREPGMPGVAGAGKSALAAALARDQEVQRAFPDGVLWLTLGRQPALAARQARLALALGCSLWPFGDVAVGKARLREFLADKACLLILDDVWQIEHLEAFNVVGPRGCLLFTTEDTGTLAMMGAVELETTALTDEEACRLLAAWAEQSEAALPPVALEVARECQNLPLTLALAGALAQTLPWDEVLRRLREVDVERLRRQFPDVLYPDPLRMVEVGVNALPPEVRARYLDLAVFPEYTPIPETTLHIFWAPEGLDAGEVSDITNILASRALAQRDSQRRLRLHPLLSAYLQGHVGNWQALHDRLLRAYRAVLPTPPSADDTPLWHTLLPNEPYLWSHLTYHLAGAHQQEQRSRLLLDFDWLQAQLEVTDIVTLNAAYGELDPDEDVRPVRDALRLATPALAEDPTQLAGQLWGRLLAHRSPEMRRLLKQARRRQNAPWLRPLTASLVPPGGPLECTLTDHRSSVETVAVTPDGRRAISGSADGWLRVWDLEQRGTFRAWPGHSRAVKGVAIWPDGRWALSASEDRMLKLWDLEGGTEIAIFQGHIYGVTAVTLLPDGRRAVSTSADGTLKVWDVSLVHRANREALQVLRGHAGPVWAVAALPDGKRVISASSDGTLRVWDLQRAAVQRTLVGHESEVYAVAVTPDGHRAISGSADHTVKVWDLERGTLTRTMRGHSGPVRAVAVTADGQWVISAATDGTLRVWDLVRGNEYCILSEHQDAVNSVAVTLDGRAISGSADRTVRVWDLERGAGLHTLTGHREAVNAVALLPGGERALSASKDGSIKLWSLKWTRAALYVLPGHSRDVLALAVIGDGHRIISASRDHTLKVWDVEQRTELGTLVGHRAPVTTVAAFADERRAVSGSADRTLIVWDVERGTVLGTLTGHQGAITAVAVTPDGRHALSASKDGTLKLWELGRGEERLTLAGHVGPVWTIALTEDGQRAVSGAADSTVRVWDVTQGVEVGVLTGHHAPVTTVAVTPDGRYVLSGSEDRTLRLWNLKDGRVLAKFTGESAILACAIAPDGLTIIAGEASGRVHFLRLEGI